MLGLINGALKLWDRVRAPWKAAQMVRLVQAGIVTHDSCPERPRHGEVTARFSVSAGGSVANDVSLVVTGFCEHGNPKVARTTDAFIAVEPGQSKSFDERLWRNGRELFTWPEDIGEHAKAPIQIRLEWSDLAGRRWARPYQQLPYRLNGLFGIGRRRNRFRGKSPIPAVSCLCSEDSR